MPKVAKVKFTDYQTSIARALDLIDAGPRLPASRLIIIKPNLTNSSPPPVTTDVAAAEAVYLYCKAHTSAPIAIGEGCGSGKTPDVYAALGYTKLSEKYGIDLIDFNTTDSVRLTDKNAHQLTEFHMPEIVPDSFIISLPVLKDHSFTVTTAAMKNMFGIAPGKFYHGSWNKSQLHTPSPDKSIVDICAYKKPDLSIVDASVVLRGMHLAGEKIPLGLILAGFDPVATDTVAAALLGHDPNNLPYLTLADGHLGSMKNIQILGSE